MRIHIATSLACLLLLACDGDTESTDAGADAGRRRDAGSRDAGGDDEDAGDDDEDAGDDDEDAGDSEDAGTDAGPEPIACGTLGAPPCPDGTFCDYELEDICGAADAPGECRPIPADCEGVADPVCGCDDMTYPNSCEAHRSSVAVAARGPCPSPDACTSDRPCGDDQVCTGFLCAIPWMCSPVEGGCTEEDTVFCSCEGVTFVAEGGCPRIPFSRPGPCEVDP